MRLRRSGFEAQEVERELDRLQELGYLDDGAFARSWVSARQSGSSSRSSRALTAELRIKGVATEVVRDALTEVDDVEAARLAVKKPAARLRNLPHPELYRRLYGYLQRRGFGYQVAREAVESVCRDLDLSQGDKSFFT